MTIKDKKTIDGFSVMARVVLKEDADLAKKLKKFSKSLINNLNLSSTIKVSKELYIIITQEIPIISMVNPWLKEDANKLVLEIKLNKSKLSINDKEIN
jgi:hypothetical protein